MGIIQDMQVEMAEFTNDLDGFAVAMTLKSTDGETASVNGLSRKHHLKLDQSTGMVINSLNASVTIHETNINTANANYPVRNTDPSSDHYQKVEMNGHKVDVADVSGIIKSYIVLESYAEETKGLIVLLLGNYRE